MHSYIILNTETEHIGFYQQRRIKALRKFSLFYPASSHVSSFNQTVLYCYDSVKSYAYFVV